MKQILILLLGMTISFGVLAQEADSQWFTDIDKAKIYAAEHDQNILMVFAGSDWCKPCIQFKKDILENTNFQNWSSDKLVILYLDFPARKKNKLSDDQTKHNESLAERFNKSGAFPNIFLINTDEMVLANPAFENQDPDTFCGTLQSAIASK